MQVQGKDLFKFMKRNKTAELSLRGLQQQIVIAIQEEIRSQCQEEVRIHAFDITHGRCMYCDLKLYGKERNGHVFKKDDLTLDHIIPVSAFGLAVKGNSAIACDSCNNEKGSLSARDYYLSRYESGKPVHFDNPADFDAFLKKEEAIYQNDWPLLLELNNLIMENRVEEVPLSLVLSIVESSFDKDRKVMIKTNRTPGGSSYKASATKESNSQSTLPWKSLLERGKQLRELFSSTSSHMNLEKQEVDKTSEELIGRVKDTIMSHGFKFTYEDEKIARHAFRVIEDHLGETDITALNVRSLMSVIPKFEFKLGGTQERSLSRTFTTIAFLSKNEDLVMNPLFYLEYVGKGRTKA